ncbi:MAG: DNA polymerase Y family protein [Alphaproteobacteria bacterium]|nr:DNA polymerase Y family protein [Alphaproteobacteria bacterium]
MRRFVSVWLPHWPTDRWCRQHPDEAGQPLALVTAGPGGLRLAALDPLAAAGGLGIGMPLAEARALLPGLSSAPADPTGDAEGLAALADWCGRFSPWIAVDGADGLILDVSGLAHLFGGEAALLQEIGRHLARLGLHHRLALAGSPAAAWAWARHGDGGRLDPSAGLAPLLALPAAALRLPAEMVADLARLGLRRVGDLARLPRAPLTRRFGLQPGQRLDLLLGEAMEPISPRHPPAERRCRIAFAEPIGRAEDLDVALERLIAELCRLMERSGLGLSRLELVCYRVDGATQRLALGLAQPSREAGHIHRLFAAHVECIDPGFGIEAMILEAVESNPLPPAQAGLAPDAGATRDLAQLLDRLVNRLSPARVLRLLPGDSHWPERAMRLGPAPHSGRQPGAWEEEERLRPLCLLPAPEPIEMEMADGEEESPRAFRWRRVRRLLGGSEGPERIEPEWWRQGAGARARDYYRIEDVTGRRYWIYREGARWYLHGLFA